MALKFGKPKNNVRIKKLRITNEDSEKMYLVMSTNTKILEIKKIRQLFI
jgi:hypothetical protein